MINNFKKKMDALLSNYSHTTSGKPELSSIVRLVEQKIIGVKAESINYLATGESHIYPVPVSKQRRSTAWWFFTRPHKR